MLKVRFTDVRVARKATETELCIGKFHLSPEQIELEDFIQLKRCWSCYRCDHNQRECQENSIKKSFLSMLPPHTHIIGYVKTKMTQSALTVQELTVP